MELLLTLALVSVTFIDIICAVMSFNDSIIQTVWVPSPQRHRIRVENMPEPFASNSASKPPRVIAIPENPTLMVPRGFHVNVFADRLNYPRWLTLTPSGDVLVTETRHNRITLLRDTNKDGVADHTAEFANRRNGLNIPFGMAFARKPGRDRRSYYFFLGNTDEVRRFDYKYGAENITGKGHKITDLPGHGYNQHWTRNVVVHPNGRKIYVSVGSRGNVGIEPLPRAAVMEMDLDGNNRKNFAHGLRNPVGLDFHPRTWDLYTTVNERDGLGDDLVPDYFTRIQQDEFFGWPYTYMSPDFLDPRMIDRRTGKSLNEELANATNTPDLLFQSHSASLGLKFYTGRTFPRRYLHGAFVAFRGSWNRSKGTGYKIVFIPFSKETRRPLSYYVDFLTGFLSDPYGPSTWGRPVGVFQLPDGSLIFTEEPNGRIYRVQYKPI